MRSIIGVAIAAILVSVYCGPPIRDSLKSFDTALQQATQVATQRQIDAAVAESSHIITNEERWQIDAAHAAIARSNESNVIVASFTEDK